MKRAVCIGGSLLALLAAAGLVRPRSSTLRRAGEGHGADARGRSALAEAVSAEESTGSSARSPAWPSTPRITSGSCIAASTRCRPTKRARRSSRGRARAASPRRRSSSSTRPGTLLASWDPKTGSGYDWPHNPAASPSTTRATCGSAAACRRSSLARGPWRGPAPAAGAAPAARGASGSGGARGAPRGRGAAPAAAPPPADAQVLKFDKTASSCCRSASPARSKAATARRASTGRAASRSTRRPTRSTSPTARQPPHRRVRRRTPAPSSALGRLRREADRRRSRRLRSERRAVAAVPHVSCVKIAKDGMVYVCDRQNNRIQVFQKDGKFVKEAFVSKTTTGDGFGVGHRVLERSQQRAVRRRRPRQEGVDPRPRLARDDRQLRRRRPLSRAGSTASAASRSTRRATSTPARPRRQARAEVREKVTTATDATHETQRRSFVRLRELRSLRGQRERKRYETKSVDRFDARRAARRARHRAEHAREEGRRAGEEQQDQVPRFEVDPTFPKPLPNHWYQGMSIGVGVDANDHVWIVHRPDSRQRRSKRRKTRRPARAARRRRRFSSSTRPATCSATGAARTATATSGPARTTASPSTTRATSGSAATAAATAWC